MSGNTTIPNELPASVQPYKRTPVFSESTIPSALLHEHKTKPGVWGRICVLEGALSFRSLAPPLSEEVISESCSILVRPEQAHEVKPLGKVKFYVEFLREI